MPTWLKVVLISLGALFIVVTAVVGGAYWWWQQNGDALIADARAAGAEGARFAAGKDGQACVDEAVTRVKDAGMSAGLKAQWFLTGCLRSARMVPEFCDGVPAPEEFVKSVSWNAQRSAEYGLGSFQAPFVLQTIQRFCVDTASSPPRAPLPTK